MNTWYDIIIALVLIVILVGALWVMYQGHRKGLPGRIYLGIGIIGIILLISIFLNSTDLSNALLAFATLILAIFTGFLVMANRDLVVENKKLRDQDIKKQQTERKERLLNEIKEWANNINLKIMNLVNNPIRCKNELENVDDKKIGRVYLTEGLNLATVTLDLSYFQSLAHEISPSLEKDISDLNPSIKSLVEEAMKISKLLLGVNTEGPVTVDNFLQAINKPPTDVAISKEYLEKVTAETDKILLQTLSLNEALLAEVAKAKLALLKQ